METTHDLANHAPGILREQIAHIDNLLQLARKQAMILKGVHEDPTASFPGAFTNANIAVAELTDLAERFEEAAAATRQPEQANGETTDTNAGTGGEAPDYEALWRVDPLIESDLRETIDNVTDSLMLLSGIFVWRDAASLVGSEERRAGIAHQIDGCVAALNLVWCEMEIQRQPQKRREAA